MSNNPILTQASVVKWHAEQITAEVDGEVVVMGLTQGKYVGLDDIGSALWHLMEHPQPVHALCARIGQRYAGDPAEIAADVLAFLEDLHGLGLIEVLDRNAATGAAGPDA